MKLNIWGARGSHPKPATPEQIKSKISAVIQRVQPEDLVSPESREAFLANLPPWLFGTYSGNTACLTVTTDAGKSVIFDAGTGITEYWKHLIQQGVALSGNEYHIFFTHYHYDHIQGFPFFVPAYIPGNIVNLYSAQPELEKTIRSQMKHPFFPVSVDAAMQSELIFHQLQKYGEIYISNTRIRWIKLEHPGGAFGYLIENDNSRVLYCSDVSVNTKMYEKTEENRAFYEKLDCIILDTQYTLDEALQKFDWGHTSYLHGVDFALHWQAKKLILFHHEPTYGDQKLYDNLKAAQNFASSMSSSALEIQIAREGDTILF